MQKIQTSSYDITTTNIAPEPFNRPPRMWTPPPGATVDIPALPAKETLPPMPEPIIMAMPLFMMTIIFGIYIFIQHASSQQLVFLLPMAVFTTMGPLSMYLSTRQKRKSIRRRNAQKDKRYRKELATIQEQLTQLTNEQRHVALISNPDPLALEAQIDERTHLWERRPEDDDFLSVRVGLGSQPFSGTLKMPQIDLLDPLAKEIRTITDTFSQVPNMPCSISLQKAKSLGITGTRQKVAALSRSMLCQLATQHSPEDLRILAIYPASQRQGWDWLRELPHTVPLKGCKLNRFTAVGEDEANELLNFLLEELSQRASKNEETAASSASDTATAPLPHLVVIVHDYVKVSKHPALTHAFKLSEQLGVSIIYLVAQEQAIPSECRGVMRLTGEEQITYAAAGFDRETLENVLADMMDLEHAFRVTRLLEGIQIIHADEDMTDIPANVRFLDLIDLPFADQFTPETWWENPPFGLLRVPIGLGTKGTVWLDLNDHVHGPHGILAGTTGAGKSELLQSLIVGLAITHHPHLVNFVLVDFKGGAAFKPFEKIPHTVGMVTDLSGNLTERALVALKGELKRREHLLSDANAKNISDYLYMRTKIATLEPVPHLLIIIDEFAELAKEHPTFMDGLVSVVQKGRSLGVHLILATQKPEGSVNANIWSNLKFRICLRVASLQDSRDMLGRSEAALLPSGLPGRGYFQIGAEIFELFQGARISLPARVANKAVFLAKQGDTGSQVTDMQVLMDTLEPYQETLGEQLFKPWAPPLAHHISLPEVYRQTQLSDPLHVEATPQPYYGWLACPMGIIDLPVEQKQEPWVLDMPRSGGHVLVTGGGGTGKSVFLRTLITSLAHTHTPAQLNFYIIDFGGQSLRIFEKLPHVGGVFGETDDEYIRLLLRKLNGIIDARKQSFGTDQIDDFLTYQRRRLENPALPELPAVVLVIDKFLEFKQVYEREMEQVLAIARSGRTYGVYLVISVDRPVALSMQFMSLIEIRIALRLVEVTDSILSIGRNDAAHIDPAIPGRGYIRSKTPEEVQIALPVTGDTDDEQTQHLEEMLALIAVREDNLETSATQNRHAPAIQLLPAHIDIHEILKPELAPAETTNGAMPHTVQQSLSLPIGIEDFSLEPIALLLNADTPHGLVVGGPGSGRTGVLQTCLLMLAQPEYRETKVLMIDFRRSSRPLRRLPHIWMYADTEEKLLAAIDTLKAELRERVTRIHEELERIADDSDEIPGTDLTPILLVIDDYEQLTALTRNPLNDLKEFLLQARDIHLHVLLAGTPADLIRSDVMLQQVKVCRMGIVLGSDPTDQPVLGVRMSDQPPGRGHLVRRSRRSLIQVAHLAPGAMRYWVNHFVQATPQTPASTNEQNLTTPSAHEATPV